MGSAEHHSDWLQISGGLYQSKHSRNKALCLIARRAYLSPSGGVGVVDGAAACVAGRVIHDAVVPTHRVVLVPATAAARVAARYQAVRTGTERTHNDVQIINTLTLLSFETRKTINV